MLKLWANLPEASLRQLMLILHFMEDGRLPMQTLMVLIGLLPKPKGGERPIALTAKLYRSTIKLRKPVIGEWQDQAHGFWDSAISRQQLP